MKNTVLNLQDLFLNNARKDILNEWGTSKRKCKRI